MKRIRAGFTLIELLLVIAVISIIVSMALMVMRKHAENARISKAALEMQNVLQAAINYAANNNGQWPQSYSCNSSSAPQPSDFLNYLPNGDYQSHYGSYFCWSQEGATHRFWVALPFPSSDYKIAEQIAAQLPNAYAIKDPNTQTPRSNLCDGSESLCYVRAEVTQSAGVSPGGIAAAGYCKPPEMTGGVVVAVRGSAANVSCLYDAPATSSSQEATYHIQFLCAAGQGNVILTPNYLYMGTQKTVYDSSVVPLRLGPDDAAQNCVTLNGVTECTIRIIAKSDISSPEGASIFSNSGEKGYIGASYIGYCDAT